MEELQTILRKCVVIMSLFVYIMKIGFSGTCMRISKNLRLKYFVLKEITNVCVSRGKIKDIYINSDK